MALSTKYQPRKIEHKWYELWLKNNYFHSEPDNRIAYSIVIPPPNVTGVLHMGHMLNNTIQDVLARYQRMLGKNVCWVPGTDHASIATEAKVVNYLKEQDIDKNSLSRDEFLKYAWQWKEKHGGIILEQLKKLGASCDWERTKFTMDDSLSESVRNVFIDLFNKGLIYRGVRMINWDVKAKTALSDEEVVYKEVAGKLYYVNYQIEGSNEFLTIATTRPETILGDTAICVHPKDNRYTHLKGKNAIVPMVNRVVPIIMDEYVDREFGTGALKITPAHDINDYNLGLKYNLDIIDIFNDDGTLNESAQLFIGTDRFEAQKLVIEKLKELNVLEKIEDYTHSVGFSERTDIVVEPKISQQWFLSMEKLAKPAIKSVLDDTIKFYPTNVKNTYRHWMENIHDWCISRQLWWGHRIPAYYVGGNPNLGIYVAKTLEEALEIAKIDHPNLKVEQLIQEEDVLDTWFSSWLWPLSVFDGINKPDNHDFKYYFPTDDLVTAPEILFFWVARMIMASYEYSGKEPFKNVYFTGIVRDKQRRKMSKSFGNSPDPIDLINQYGADGVRVGMLLCSPAGNDLLFDISLVEQGRNFSNKIWNAFRLIKSWNVDYSIAQPEYAKEIVTWFKEQLNKAIIQVRKYLNEYKFSEAVMVNYTLFWDDFASWYLEAIKPPYGEPIDNKTIQDTIAFFGTILKLMHPFIPFITEEIYHELYHLTDDETIMFQNYPNVNSFDEKAITKFSNIKEIVSQTRNIRQNNGISPKEKLKLTIENKNFNSEYLSVLKKIGNFTEISFQNIKPDNAIAFLVGTNKCFVHLKTTINVEAELIKLEDELNYLKGFLNSVMKKLNNKNFVNNAPANIVEIEEKKKNDAQSKIISLENQISEFKTLIN